jgi:hypothetical protein
VSDFSRPPLEMLLASLGRGYVGLHLEQGVPVLDRDLNLMQDLLAAGTRALFTRYVGNGTAEGRDGFRVIPPDPPSRVQDFGIDPGPGGQGTCLVDGIEVSIDRRLSYTDQQDAPVLTTPAVTQPDPRVDVVYLDVTLVEVDATIDPDLRNDLDVGMETSVRLRPTWSVRVAEDLRQGGPLPAPPPGHGVYPLALLRRPRGRSTIDAAMITDLRQRRLTLAAIEQRVSRVERILLTPAFSPDVAQQLSPVRGVVGAAVTLIGKNFDVAPVTVSFDGQAAPLDGPPSSTSVVVHVPPGLTPNGVTAVTRVTIRNEVGSATSDQVFQVLPNPIFRGDGPQFSPATGKAGDQVVLFGFNFDIPGLVVRFGGVQAALVGTPNATSAVVVVPPDLVAPGRPPQKVSISVEAPGLQADNSSQQFTANPSIPAPTIDGFSPLTGGGGTAVTIKGQNLNNPPVQVEFDGTKVTPQPPQVSAIQIVVTLPSGLTPRNVFIAVSTAGGRAVGAVPFTITG